MVDTLNSSAPHIHGATTFDDLSTGACRPMPSRAVLASTGRLLFKGPNNQPETGIWVCTPGKMALSIPRDEFCHFVAGSATYRAMTAR
jgi:uncharacterized protein